MSMMSSTRISIGLMMKGIVSKPNAVGANRSTPGPNLCFMSGVLHRAVADLATALIVNPVIDTLKLRKSISYKSYKWYLVLLHWQASATLGRLQP